MAFATVNLLAAVRATLLAALGRLDRLAVDGGNVGRRRTPGLSADLLPQGVEQTLPGAIAGPPLEVVVDGLPRREVVRQRPPGSALACMVEQGIDDFAQVGLARLPTPVSTRKQGLEQGPLLVRQVTRIPFAFHAECYAKSD